MNFDIAPKRQKSEDKSNLGGPCHHFGSKNIAVDLPLSIVFSIYQKLENIDFIVTLILWACFPILKSLILQLEFHCFFMCFQTASRDCFYRVPVPMFTEHLDFDATFDFMDFQIDAFWTNFWDKAPTKNIDRCPLARSLPRPCFSSNHNNYCAVWT